MQKLFLSTSFSSGKLDTDGNVLPEFRAEVEQLLGLLRGSFYTVFCAVEQMDWTVSHNPPEEKTRELLAELESSDLVVSLLSDIISAGVQLEIGYAIAKGKLVVMAAEAGTSLPYVNQGIVNLGLAKTAGYTGVQDLADQIMRISEGGEGNGMLPLSAASHMGEGGGSLRKVRDFGGPAAGSAIAPASRLPVGSAEGARSLETRGVVTPPEHTGKQSGALSRALKVLNRKPADSHGRRPGKFARATQAWPVPPKWRTVKPGEPEAPVRPRFHPEHEDLLEPDPIQELEDQEITEMPPIETLNEGPKQADDGQVISDTGMKSAWPDDF